MKKNVLSVSIFMLIFTGCGEVFTGYNGVLGEYDSIYTKNLCDDKLVKEKIENNEDLILWTQLGGSLKRNCKDYNHSNVYFDQAEELYKTEVDLENFMEKGLKTVGTTITNDNALDYQGNVHEAIMLNAYKGLNFMSMEDFSSARVEFNRALDRQRRAKDKFAQNIKAKQEKIQKEDKNQKANSQTENYIQQSYSKSIFEGFQAYPDFINPFVTYISALFYMADKDYLKARDLFKESVAMQPENNIIKKDFYLVEQILKENKAEDKYVWLIYENGKSMMKDEFRLDIPLFIFSKNIYYTGIALPTLKEQASSYEHLILGTEKTEAVCDMDKVIKTEFKIKLPYIITQAVIRTVAKTVAQKQLNDENAYAGIAMGLYNALTNKADVRSWVSLPKGFQSARVKNNGDIIQILTNDKKILHSIQVPRDKNAIIYLKSSSVGFYVTHEIYF